MWRRVRLVLLVLGGLFVGYFVYVIWGLPGRSVVRSLARQNPGKTGVMRQREQEALRARRTPRHVQTWVPLSRISRHLINAVVTAEDPKFFGHEGIDWDAVKESFEKNLEQGRYARGGSTITQQLAKNLYFTTHKSLTRKLREFIVTGWLEDDLTKARILELYLNVIEWGDGVYGCEAAAHQYYGKPSAALTEVEAAGLAAMIPSPRRINPRLRPSLHVRAQRRVLWLMAKAGYVRRDVGGLGAEPPPVEAVEEEGDEPAEPEPTPAPVATVTPEVTPLPEPTPTPKATPTTEPTPTPTPGATPTPP